MEKTALILFLCENNMYEKNIYTYITKHAAYQFHALKSKIFRRIWMTKKRFKIISLLTRLIFSLHM